MSTKEAVDETKQGKEVLEVSTTPSDDEGNSNDEEAPSTVESGTPNKDDGLKNNDDDIIHPRYAHLSVEERQALVRALSQQSYHLPGNTTWWQDWRQYFLQNNHPVFGICFHHPLHPVPTCMRILFLFSSIIFGLTVTNLVWIWFVMHDSLNSDLTLVQFGVGINDNSTNPIYNYIEQLNEENKFQITTGMALLWTVGGIVHAIYDNIIWNLTLCACCMEGRKLAWAKKYKNVGVGLLSFGIIILLGGTTLMVVVRSSLEQEENAAVVKQKLTSISSAREINSLWKENEDFAQFMLGYTVELFLSLFVYFFIVGTIMFSGVFGCCKRVPMFGGRPYELQRLQKEQDLYGDQGMEVVIDEEGEDVVLEEGQDEERPSSSPKVV